MIQSCVERIDGRGQLSWLQSAVRCAWWWEGSRSGGTGRSLGPLSGHRISLLSARGDAEPALYTLFRVTTAEQRNNMFLLGDIPARFTCQPPSRPRSPAIYFGPRLMFTYLFSLTYSLKDTVNILSLKLTDVS